MTNAKHPLVSIGIPTFNRAGRHLGTVIERALAQTYKNIEVIVSDNCSTDNTPDLVQSIKDPRLRYFRHKTNIGANNNFNFCLNQANGEYFLLFHDDDMIDEDMIEACMAALKPGQEVGAVFTGVRIIDEHGNVLGEHPNRATPCSAKEFIRGWFKGNMVALFLCNTLYNTGRLKAVGGFGSKKNLYGDLVPTFTLITRYGRADVRDIKAGFRRHSGNRGSTIPIQHWIEDSLYVLDLLYELFPEDRAVMSKEGKLYFCRTMYRYAATGTAVMQSPLDYWRIYKAFEYCYSPLRYFYGARLRPRLGRTWRTLFGKPSQAR
jgi:glycosyltransferase involved in cell wall biosynthesis